MMRCLVLLIILGSYLCFLARPRLEGWLAVWRGDGPLLVVDHAKFHKGDVAAGAPLEVSFPVRNEGGRRLVIHEDPAAGACACEVRQTLILSPGQTGRLSAKLSTAAAAGVTDWHLSFVSNDLKRPHFGFMVVANVHAPVGTPTPASESPRMIHAQPPGFDQRAAGSR